ncbi:transcription repressor NadR [Clostridium formicaceticum]|uniref:Transcription repressor NadR n=1 Tax=Clostridium formicaceticum TaxID=1497 RepID=A0AAC9WEJ7_9CLOT|nr:transcription repressor NadR [Clostridium formicaceticum]AOY75427.1 transcription repressor NadR [Clostridium formicaceticum]ARE85708.1 putative transcription repressor NiaR [Clostridium formicaceticum]
MNSKERRKAIVKALKEENKPKKGTELASYFDVSRQVIVQDIALLRAEGVDIIATPQGYVIPRNDTDKIKKTIVSKHTSYKDMKEELKIMIHHGARILDVIVEHPIYGEIKGILDISYRKELDEFMDKVKNYKAEPLSSLTEGVHIHTVEVPDEETFKKMQAALLEKGYLINE